jgi:5'-deoxynucleotidase YfbR-like HD superfamily hydrolase
MNYDAHVDQVLEQLRGYAAVHRKSIQPFTRDKLLGHFPDYHLEFDHVVARESLLEHVGCLPILAAFIHPHLDQDVNLGHSLIMLSIHDIGELEVGDELTFLKAKDQSQSEYEAAQRLLHPNYRPIYDELDALTTNEAKFVKSVDKLAPDLFDYLCGEQFTIDRMVRQAGWAASEAIQNIRQHKRPFMEWSTYLTGIHDALWNRFESIAKKEV